MKDEMKFIRNLVQETSCLDLGQLLAYNDSRISDDDQYDIEKHMIDCPLCSQSLEGLNDFDNIITFQNDVKRINKKVLDYTQPKRKTYILKEPMMYYGTAAVIILAVISTLALFKRSPQNNDLFDSYFNVHPVSIPMLRGENSLNLMQEAMYAYQKENYWFSLQLLNQIGQEDKYFIMAQFYKGVISLCLDNPQQAVFYLNPIVQINNHDYFEQALWYISLAYIKNRDIDQAKNALEKLADLNGFKYHESIDIIRHLKYNDIDY